MPCVSTCAQVPLDRSVDDDQSIFCVMLPGSMLVGNTLSCAGSDAAAYSSLQHTALSPSPQQTQIQVPSCDDLRQQPLAPPNGPASLSPPLPLPAAAAYASASTFASSECQALQLDPQSSAPTSGMARWEDVTVKILSYAYTGGVSAVSQHDPPSDAAAAWAAEVSAALGGSQVSYQSQASRKAVYDAWHHELSVLGRYVCIRCVPHTSPYVLPLHVLMCSCTTGTAAGARASVV